MLALLLVASWCNLSLDQPLLKTWLTWPSTLIFQKLKPHIFTVGEQTYRNVKSLIEPINQSIVVSGESGAGKVEVPVSYPVSYTWPGERKGEDHCLCHQWLPSHSQTGCLNQVNKHHTRSQKQPPLLALLAPWGDIPPLATMFSHWRCFWDP